MKALVSPNEIAFSYDGTPLGERIAQVEEIGFPVSPPLFWTDCPNDCVADLWYYSNGQCLPKPLPPEPEPQE
jgi:hypothetical protein